MQSRRRRQVRARRPGVPRVVPSARVGVVVIVIPHKSETEKEKEEEEPLNRRAEAKVNVKGSLQANQ